MARQTTRREFLAVTAAGAMAAAAPLRARQAKAPLYKISLAQWSINQPLRKGTLQHLDFAKIARGVGIDAIEYVNQFFMDKATDAAYLAEMNTRAKGEGVTQVLIMCDREGNLGDPDTAKRRTAVENHYKWVTAAKTLPATRFASMPTALARRRSSRSWWPMACISCACSPTRMASTSSSRTTVA